MEADLDTEIVFDPSTSYDGRHEEGSPWLSDGSSEAGRDRARWVRRTENHGFIDFNHVFRPCARGAGKTHSGVALARCTLTAEKDMEARLLLSWDDELRMRIRDNPPIDLGGHGAFRTKEVKVNLKKGGNPIFLKLSNTLGSNHGGWVFCFKAEGDDGSALHAEAVQRVP